LQPSESIQTFSRTMKYVSVVSLAVLAFTCHARVSATPFVVQDLLDVAFSRFGSENTYDVSWKEEKGTVADVLSKDKRFSKLVELVGKNKKLLDMLKNKNARLTTFAPTNEAFDRFESENDGDEVDINEILSYHIVPKDEVQSKEMHNGQLLSTNLRLDTLKNDAQVLRICTRGRMCFCDQDICVNSIVGVEEADMESSNGIIHVVDRVITPPKSIMEEAKDHPRSMSMFTKAIERSGMENEINNARGVTVFAPFNNAWRKLGRKNLKYLFDTDEGRKMLKKVLMYHISPETLYADLDLREEDLKTIEAPTLLGRDIRVEGNLRDRDTLEVEVEGKRVRFQDGLSSQGPLHFLEDVLIPEGFRLPHPIGERRY